MNNKKRKVSNEPSIYFVNIDKFSDEEIVH